VRGAKFVAAKVLMPASIAPGQIAPRDALVGLPLHKVDLRITKEVKLRGDFKLTGIAEVLATWKKRIECLEVAVGAITVTARDVRLQA